MADWIFDNFPWVIGGVMAIAFGCVAVGIHHENQAEAEAQEVFMADCLKHRPQYECTALWRSSRPPRDTTTVVPVLIPVGGR